jgi:hypothetical protein
LFIGECSFINITSHQVVKNRARDFKYGREFCEHGLRSGNHRTFVTEQFFAKICVSSLAGVEKILLCESDLKKMGSENIKTGSGVIL